MTEYNEARAFCDSVKPSWASISTASDSTYCVFESCEDYKEINYRKEIYYLIDGNKLGRKLE